MPRKLKKLSILVLILLPTIILFFQLHFENIYRYPNWVSYFFENALVLSIPHIVSFICTLKTGTYLIKIIPLILNNIPFIIVDSMYILSSGDPARSMIWILYFYSELIVVPIGLVSAFIWLRWLQLGMERGRTTPIAYRNGV